MTLSHGIQSCSELASSRQILQSELIPTASRTPLLCKQQSVELEKIIWRLQRRSWSVSEVWKEQHAVTALETYDRRLQYKILYIWTKHLIEHCVDKRNIFCVPAAFVVLVFLLRVVLILLDPSADAATLASRPS